MLTKNNLLKSLVWRFKWQASRTLVSYRTANDDKVGIITLDNPGKMNALTEAMGDALFQVLTDVQKNLPRVIVVTGSG